MRASSAASCLNESATQEQQLHARGLAIDTRYGPHAQCRSAAKDTRGERQHLEVGRLEVQELLTALDDVGLMRSALALYTCA